MKAGRVILTINGHSQSLNENIAIKCVASMYMACENKFSDEINGVALFSICVLYSTTLKGEDAIIKAGMIEPEA